MLMESLDRDVIFSKVIGMASPEERAAFLGRACGHDVALRQQVERMVVVYFQTVGAAQSSPAAANGSPHGGHDPSPAGANHSQTGETVPTASSQPKKETPTHARGLKAAAVVLLAAAAVSSSWAVLAGRSEKQAQAEARKAVTERDEARKEEEKLKQQLDQALATRRTVEEERKEARKAEKAAQSSEQDARAALDFVENNLLSVGRDKGWGSKGLRKNVTLREAVNAAEPKVAALFQNRPLVEASIRVVLGSAYLDLGEPDQAVKQLKRALELREGWLGPDHRDTGDVRNKLAIARRRAGDGEDEVGDLFEQGTDSSTRAAALAVRGAALLAQNKPVEAELKLRECLTIRQKIRPDDWATFDAQVLLGEALLAQKKYAEAEQLLVQGYEGLKQQQAKIPSSDKGRLTKALQRLVQVYEAQNDTDKANQWRKELEKVEATKKP
jgi:tetratricopeptide (TPR) repeat protein